MRLNPDRLVLGGGVVWACGDLYLNPFSEELKAALGGWTAPEIKVATLERRVGVIGGYLLAQE